MLAEEPRHTQYGRKVQSASKNVVLRHTFRYTRSEASFFMNLKHLAIVILFGISASCGYAVGGTGTASLGLTEEESGTQARLVFGLSNPAASIPGGNMIEGAGSASGSQLAGLPNITAAVPEPSTVLLSVLGALGCGMVRVRGRRQ